MNLFQQRLPPEIFREVFRREPAALFDRLDEAQTLKVKLACVALRDAIQQRLMMDGRDLPAPERRQLDEQARALNSVL